QPGGDRSRKPSEHLVGGVDDVPGVRDITRPGGEGLHWEIPCCAPGGGDARPARISKVDDCTILCKIQSMKAPLSTAKGDANCDGASQCDKKKARSYRPRRGFHHRRRMEEFVRGAEGGDGMFREQA